MAEASGNESRFFCVQRAQSYIALRRDARNLTVKTNLPLAALEKTREKSYPQIQMSCDI